MKKKSRKQKCWTPKEIGRLIAMVNDGLSYADICQELERSYKSVTMKAHQLHEAGRIGDYKYKPRPWTCAERNRLAELRASGYSTDEICRFLNRSKLAVYSAQRLITIEAQSV